VDSIIFVFMFISPVFLITHHAGFRGCDDGPVYFA